MITDLQTPETGLIGTPAGNPAILDDTDWDLERKGRNEPGGWEDNTPFVGPVEAPFDPFKETDNQDVAIVATTEPRQVEIIDGFMIDSETGEYVGVVTPKPVFAVQDEESCNWVLGKILDAEASVAAIEKSEEVIRALAVLENASAMTKERKRKLDWLHRRFDPELGEYARKQLEGKKERTLKTLLGSISLRIKKGGLRVKDAEIALDWARLFLPEAIKTTEAFQISLVPADVKAQIIANPSDYRTGMFEVELDSETITVKTGVQS